MQSNARWILVLLTVAACSSHSPVESGYEGYCSEHDARCEWLSAWWSVQSTDSWHERETAFTLGRLRSDSRSTGRVDAYPRDAITQVAGVSCFGFSAIANVEPDTVNVSFDFHADGAIDYRTNLPAARWERVEVIVSGLEEFAGLVAVQVAPHPGLLGGAVALPQLVHLADEDCEGESFEFEPFGIGRPCEQDGDCASETCVDDVCSKCATDDECRDGSVCGLRVQCALIHDCVREGSKVLGERCAVGDECESGICCHGLCSPCCSSDDCGGETCALGPWAWIDEDTGRAWEPSLCARGERKGAPGALCIEDIDCAAGRCVMEDTIHCTTPNPLSCAQPAGASGPLRELDPTGPEDCVREVGHCE